MVTKRKLNEKEFKFNKILKVISIACLIVIAVELIGMALLQYINDKKNTYYDLLYKINVSDDKYLGAGSSQFKYSKFNNWQKGYEKAKLVSYNQKGKILFEKTFKSDYNSTYYSAIKVNDGFIAVGSYESKKYQLEDKTRDALIVKYDEKGKVLWYKNYQVLGDAKFLDVIEDNNGYIVVGQSIYQSMEIGNHDNGGGIIVKYDPNGNIVWKNNFGGNKSGIFNSIIKVNDGYIVVGKDSVNTGLLVKFDFDGKRIWFKNYSYTDKIGFTDIAKTDDDYLLVVGAKEIDKDLYDALVVKYSLDGDKIDEYTLTGKKNERFNAIATTMDGFITVGYTNSNDIGIKDFKVEEKDQTGIITKYDNLGNITWIKSFGGNKYDNLTDVILGIPKQSDVINKKENYVIVGHSQSKFNIFSGMKSNGKDYFSRFLIYDMNGKNITSK